MRRVCEPGDCSDEVTGACIVSGDIGRNEGLQKLAFTATGKLLQIDIWKDMW